MNDDCISRAAANAIIENKQKQLCPLGIFSRHAVYGTDRERFDAWQEIIDEIDGLPSVLPQVVHGRWIECDDDINTWLRCSVCGFEQDLDDFSGHPHEAEGYRLCPSCGAQMGGEDDAAR